MKLIDFHVHVFPDAMGRVLPALSQGSVLEKFGLGVSADHVHDLRKRARSLARPLVGKLHQAQTVLRHLPEAVRRGLDEVSGVVPLPALLLESSPRDLNEALEDSGLDGAVVIAAPPFATNEFVLETCADLAQGGKKLFPAVNIPKGVNRPAVTLRRLADQGAKLLKIHAATDGEGPETPRYRALLKAATDLGLPVILHTGCVHSHVLYKKPEYGQVDRFERWFESFPETRFILAHMNMHEPLVALDLAQQYPNLFVDTSWQPAEAIAEAVRRIGAERVLYASDWPLVGGNIDISLGRVQECVDSGLLRPDQAELILGKNALALLGEAKVPETVQAGAGR